MVTATATDPAPLTSQKHIFFGKFVCTSKGYIEREISLPSLERKGGTFQGSLCPPLKSGVFLALLNAPVRARTVKRGQIN